MKTRANYCIVLCLLVFSQRSLAQNVRILINHIGYEPDAAKRVVILGHQTDTVTSIMFVDEQTGKEIVSVPAVKIGAVDRWKDWCFWSADFSQLHDQGTYFAECDAGHGTVRSFPFLVQHDLL